MRTEDFKGTWLLGAGLVVLGLVFFSGYLGTSGKPKQIQDELGGYQMIRPNSFAAKFDLSDRAVDRQIKSLDKKSTQTKAKNNNTDKKKSVAQKGDAKKSKKKDKKQLAKRKKGVYMQVVDDSRKGFSGTRGDGVESAKHIQTNYIANTVPAEPVKKQEEPKISIAQWKEILFASPTSSNGMAFLMAYRKGDISSENFFSLSAELLQDERETHKNLSLYLLSAINHGRVFEILVLNATVIPESKREDVLRLLDAFANRDKLNYLARLLIHPEMAVALEATRVLGIAISRAQAVNGQDDRDGRDALAPTVESLSSFLPILQRLSNANNEISPEAQSLYQRIQDLLS